MSVQIWLGRRDSNLFPDYGAALKDKSEQSPVRRAGTLEQPVEGRC